MKSMVISLQRAFIAAGVLSGILVSAPGLTAGPIHDAVRKNDLAAVERAVAANPSAINSKAHGKFLGGEMVGTPLHFAAVMGNKAIVKLLLDKGADASIADNEGFTPLHLACWKGHKDVVEILVDAPRVNVNALTIKPRKTALHLALEGFPIGPQTPTKQKAAIVEILLKKGADPNIKDGDGLTAMQFAQNSGDPDILNAFKNAGVKMPRVLIVAPLKDSYTIPFTLHPVVLVKGKVNDREMTFVFDTGASHTVISTRAAKAAGVRTSGQFTFVPAIGAGDAILRNHRVAVMDIPQFAQFQMMGLNVQGILGYPYLSQFVITFDYRKKEITLIPKDAAPPLKEEQGSFMVPFDLTPGINLIFVQGHVNGQGPLTLLIDTGAQEIFIMPATARKLGLRGSIAESIKVGGAEVKRVPVMISNPPQVQPLAQVGQKCDGVLGRPFLSKFLITIDYRTKQLKLKPN